MTLRAWPAMLAVLAALAMPAFAQQESRRTPSVLMLVATRSTAPTVAQFETAFRKAAEAGLGDSIDYHVEYLDLPDDQVAHVDLLAGLLRAKYRAHPPALVVANGGQALQFLLQRRDDILPGVPILHAGLTPDTVAQMSLPAEATGVELLLDRQRTLQVALGLHPDARRVVIVGGGSASDLETARLAERLARAQSPTIEVVQLAGTVLEAQLRRVASLPRDSVIVFTSYRADSLGRSTVAADTLQQLARVASVPTYGAVDLWLGHGIVGGDLLSYDTIGRQAGTLAARILKGEPAQSIPPIQDTASALMFDWRELRRWGIDERLLPEGSTVLFTEFSLWQQYRWVVVSLIGVLAGEGLLIGFLLAERRTRRRAQGELVEAERRYRTVADFTADWEYWVNADGSVAYTSPSCLAITGRDASSFISQPSLISDIVAHDDRARWDAHRLAPGTGDEPARLEFRITTLAGDTRWIDHVCTRVVGADGADLGIRGSNRDITERKRAEERLRVAFEEIERLRDRLEVDNSYLREQLREDVGFENLLGASDPMRDVISKVRQVAPTESTVLLLGETGVGKSVTARAIHHHSSRRARPLITLNCASLPATLIETELFGHERGAFTGAHAQRRGRFEIADGSTLFLDEIGDLPLDLQGKLLRAIQDGEFERVGGNVTLTTDVRLIAATNRRLDEDVQQGRFRQDLWYRLSVFPITVPPLRQRREDIPALVRHFVEKHSRKLGRSTLQVSRAAMKSLQSQDWPGNIRELENVVERAVISTRGAMIDQIEEPVSADRRPPATAAAADDLRSLEQVERDHIVSTLERLQWRVTGKGGAAEVLDINSSTLRSRMRKLGIQRPPPSPATGSAAQRRS